MRNMRIEFSFLLVPDSHGRRETPTRTVLYTPSTSMATRLLAQRQTLKDKEVLPLPYTPPEDLEYSNQIITWKMSAGMETTA